MAFLLEAWALELEALASFKNENKKEEKRALITQVSTEKNCDVVPDGCICEAECSQKESGRRQGKCTSGV